MVKSDSLEPFQWLPKNGLGHLGGAGSNLVWVVPALQGENHPAICKLEQVL